jgi:hypothetical protein
MFHHNHFCLLRHLITHWILTLLFDVLLEPLLCDEILHLSHLRNSFHAELLHFVQLGHENHLIDLAIFDLERRMLLILTPLLIVLIVI